MCLKWCKWVLSGTLEVQISNAMISLPLEHRFHISTCRCHCYIHLFRILMWHKPCRQSDVPPSLRVAALRQIIILIKSHKATICFSSGTTFHSVWQDVHGKWRKPEATVSLKMPSGQHVAKRAAAALICTKLSMSHGASHLPQWLCSAAPACIWRPSSVPNWMATTPIGANGCLLPWCSALRPSKMFEKVSSTQKIKQSVLIYRIFKKFCQWGTHGPVFQGIPVPCELDDFLTRAPCSSSRNGVNLL